MSQHAHFWGLWTLKKLLNHTCYSWHICRIQFGLETTLEAQYTISFRVKFAKNICWHKMCQGNWVCERHWEMLELVGYIYTFINEDYWASIQTKSNEIAWELYVYHKTPAIFILGWWHFRQDNKRVNNSICVSNFVTVPNPDYRSQLALCHFWLFTKLKENIKGSCFETIEEMKEVVARVANIQTGGLPGVVGMKQLIHCSWKGSILKGVLCFVKEKKKVSLEKEESKN